MSPMQDETMIINSWLTTSLCIHECVLSLSSHSYFNFYFVCFLFFFALFLAKIVLLYDYLFVKIVHKVHAEKSEGELHQSPEKKN
jgi:hypothetical protein